MNYGKRKPCPMGKVKGKGKGSLGSTTIIENMKDMGAMFMSLAPQKGKGKGKK